jgi:tocopherol cyclase
MTKYIWLIAFLLFASPITFADTSSDPYNALIWNRDNAMAQNGQIDTGDWYEWWYFKFVDPKTGEAFYFTYGVVNPWDKDHTLSGTGASVQIGSFNRHLIVSGRYPVSQFLSRYDKTDIEIGKNRATDQHLQGKISENGHHVAWNLSVKKDWGFDAMGWAMTQPDVSNIYWYPAQAAAQISGAIQFDGQTIRVDRAPGYQDRNWGRSFPKWWTWLTSNGFTGFPETVLAAGGGEPKVLNAGYVTGLCIGLRHQGHEYVFRTTDGDDVDFKIGWGVWNISATNDNNEKIEISAFAPETKFLTIPFPSPRGSNFYDYEVLTGHMNVKVFTRESVFSDWKLLADLNSDSAGIEWGTPTPVNSISAVQMSKRY